MNEFYHKFYSQYLQRDFEMLVFGHSGLPVVLFPKAGGRYYEMKDSGVIDAISGQLEAGKIKVYCPDTIDYESWYNYDIDPASRVNKHLQYQQTILKDVVEFARYELNKKQVGVVGFEFGAYHATNFAFKYPDFVSSLICLGGTYDIKRHIMGFYNDNCYFNNPLDYIPGLNDEWHLNYIEKMDIRICIGSNDEHFMDNLYFSELLGNKEINHQLEMCHGIGNDFNFYRSKLRSFLE